LNDKTNIEVESRTDKSRQLDLLVSLRPELLNKIHYGDSFEFLEGCPPNVFDLILEDMPYNTTACEWDVKLDLQLYWKTRLRILKPTGAIVLTASQPFTSELVISNRKMFKYGWVWTKNIGSNFLNAKREPMKEHEDILIFCNGVTKYNPQRIPRLDKERAKYPYKPKKRKDGEAYGQYDFPKRVETDLLTRVPSSILKFNREAGLHPTQKPVDLFEYLIRTYTNEGELVFDGFGGSGTTAIAAYKSNRNFIVVEKEQKYFELSQKRLAVEQQQCRLFEASN